MMLIIRGVRISRVDEGWSYIQQDAGQALSLFVPNQTAADVNERSIAVHARHMDREVLLTADMSKAGLRQILASGVPGDISLLKLPHHGSRYAAPESFLEQFMPSAAFASTGRDNPYGFPHVETVKACALRQIPLYRTDQMGMLRFHVQDGEWQVSHGNSKSFRID